MRCARAGEVRDYRGLAVLRARARNARLLADEGARAIGADHQARGQLATILQPDSGFALAHAQLADRRAGMQRKALLRFQPPPEGLLQAPVLYDPRQLAHAAAIGVEFDRRLAVVAMHAHRVHGREVLRRDRAPGAQPRKERRVARADRVDARIEALRRSAWRRRRLLRQQRDSLARERARGRRAHQGAAHDGDVELRVRAHPRSLNSLTSGPFWAKMRALFTGAN